MLDLDTWVLEALILAALAIAVLLTGVVILLGVRLRRMRRDLIAAIDAGAGEDVVGALGRHDDELSGLRRDLSTVHANTEHLRQLLRTTVSKVGVVRYDAFGDMGGALSFSAALLDEQGDGMVISAINGRTETRCYAKPVVRGDSDHNLSREEGEAITSAIEGRAPFVLPPEEGRKRRRRAS
jgi:hypothetical protein